MISFDGPWPPLIPTTKTPHTYIYIVIGGRPPPVDPPPLTLIKCATVKQMVLEGVEPARLNSQLVCERNPNTNHMLNMPTFNAYVTKKHAIFKYILQTMLKHMVIQTVEPKIKWDNGYVCAQKCGQQKYICGFSGEARFDSPTSP